MIPTEFVLGRAGKWLPLAFFYRMPVPERRAEFIFGTAAEVMEMMGKLPSKAVIMRPGATAAGPEAAEPDEMAVALQAGKQRTDAPSAAAEPGQGSPAT